MATMNKKGIKNRKHLRNIIRTHNVKISRTNVIPHGGKLLRKFKNERGVENMENTMDYNNMTSGQRSARALRILKKGFYENKMSEDDPVIKDILERTKTYAK